MGDRNRIPRDQPHVFYYLLQFYLHTEAEARLLIHARDMLCHLATAAVLYSLL